LVEVVHKVVEPEALSWLSRGDDDGSAVVAGLLVVFGLGEDEGFRQSNVRRVSMSEFGFIVIAANAWRERLRIRGVWVVLEEEEKPAKSVGPSTRQPHPVMDVLHDSRVLIADVLALAWIVAQGGHQRTKDMLGM
jgi:hypothetical protein